jgi:hypothetical protein
MGPNFISYKIWHFDIIEKDTKLTYWAMSVSFYVTLKLNFPATSILYINLLWPMIPYNVRWLLQCTSNYTSKYNYTTSLHISIGIANQFCSGHCCGVVWNAVVEKKTKTKWETENYLYLFNILMYIHIYVYVYVWYAWNKHERTGERKYVIWDVLCHKQIKYECEIATSWFIVFNS